jgi:cytidylate kinase
MTVITITGDLGATRTLATSLALTLGYKIADEELVRRVASRLGWDAATAAAFDERPGSLRERVLESMARHMVHGVVGDPWFPAIDLAGHGNSMPTTERERWLEALRAVVSDFADEGNVLIVGRGSQSILAGHPDTLHVRVTANAEDRAARVAQRLLIPLDEARRHIERAEADRAQWYRTHFGIDHTAPQHYAMTINTSTVQEADAVRAIVDATGAVASMLAPHAASTSEQTEEVDCPHTILRSVAVSAHTPRQATGYWCDACGAPFTPQEATRIRDTHPIRPPHHAPGDRPSHR